LLKKTDPGIAPKSRKEERATTPHPFQDNEPIRYPGACESSPGDAAAKATMALPNKKRSFLEHFPKKPVFEDAIKKQKGKDREGRRKKTGSNPEEKADLWRERPNLHDRKRATDEKECERREKMKVTIPG